MQRVFTIARAALHGVLFLVAAGIFALGLGVGLQISPAAGSVLWITAGVVALANCGLIGFWVRDSQRA